VKVARRARSGRLPDPLVASASGSQRRAAISEARRFDELVGEISAAFVRAPEDQIDDEIKRWHKQIVLSLDLDRSGIGRIDAQNKTFYLIHQWARPSIPRNPEALNFGSRAPFLTQKLLAGETVIYSHPDELPKDFDLDLKQLGDVAPRSYVGIPMVVGGITVGAVGFATQNRSRKWPRQILRRLHLVAEIYSNALQRQRAAAANAVLRAELTHVSRAATMGELAASIAHELNQPLAAILQNAEVIQSLLAVENPDLDEVRAAIADIVEDDGRAGEIIRRLRSFFRRDAVSKTRIELGTAVGEIARIVQSDAIVRNVALELDVSPRSPSVSGDRIQLQQAVINLVLNAFDAAASAKQGPREVVLKIPASDNGWARILVSDSGDGIKPEVLPRIFDAFYTTKPSGMGMGLLISRSIVEAHGGQLTASSNPERGATFEIALPTLLEAGR
jgi:signal transduction histidine kinase